MSKIVIIDYQLGNLFSVRQALQNIGLDVVIGTRPEDLEQADAAVLPGVGAFGDAMKNLQLQGLVPVIRKHIESGKPFMGVCLGLQLLFSESEEFGSASGLDVFKGTVRRFNNFDTVGNTVKVPQIAWNEIYQGEVDWNNTPFQSLKQNENMYFVHSFYVEPATKEHVLSRTRYHNKEYTSAVIKNNIFACQFHPEKSAGNGLSIYKNWAEQNNLI